MAVYKICIISPFPPAQGGMSELANNMSNNFVKDGNYIFKVNTSISKHNFFHYLRLYYDLIKKIIKCDIVQIISSSGKSTWAINLPAIIISKIAKKKVILNFVGGSAVDPTIKWSIIKKAPFIFSDIVVVPTSNFGNGLIKVGLIKRYVIIPHVVKLDRFENIKFNRNENIILAIKSLSDYSNFEILINIFEEVKRKVPKVKLWIAGDGPNKEKLLEILDKKKILNVKLLGNIDNKNLPKIISKVCVYAHTSKYESFGISIVEAMASGLPVVAFSVGGVPNVIDHKINGFLVPYRNEEKFAENIIKIIKDDKIQTGLSYNSKLKSRDYSWSKIGKLWYELFKDFN